jgi:hypothetical protein
VYEVRRFDRVQAWLDNNADDADRCRAMAIWLLAALSGPKELAHGVLKPVGRGHRLYYAVVPGTGAMVTYFVGDLPVRVITIVSIIPAPDS